MSHQTDDQLPLFDPAFSAAIVHFLAATLAADPDRLDAAESISANVNAGFKVATLAFMQHDGLKMFRRIIEAYESHPIDPHSRRLLFAALCGHFAGFTNGFDSAAQAAGVDPNDLATETPDTTSAKCPWCLGKGSI